MVVNDNAVNIVKAVCTLGWVDIDCFAHTLNLVAKAGNCICAVLTVSKQRSSIDDATVADFINELLAKGEPEIKLSGFEKQYLTPGNCPNLGAVRVNPEIWRVLPPGAQQADKYRQPHQLRLSKALTALSVAMDGVRMAASLVPSLNTVFSKLINVFSLVNAVNRAENRRGERKLG